jgi:uracil-DNA glycosylase family 4
MANPSLEADFLRLMSLIRPCTMCNIPPPAYPIVSGSFGAKVMSVGQCPGEVECRLGIPFAGTGGKTLFAWLTAAGIEEKRFRAGAYMTAVTKCYPAPDSRGRRETPLPREVMNCAPYLVQELRIVQPEAIIAIGGMAISRLLGDMKLTEAVGRVFTRRYHSFDTLVIPLPHPSGRSAWQYMGENRKLLDKALAHVGRLCKPLL